MILPVIVTVFISLSPSTRSQQKTYKDLWINIPSCPLEFRMNSSLNALSQQSTLEELWLNIPSSPLEVRFTPSKRDSLLYNRSAGRVVRYRVGCVVGKETDKLKVVRKTQGFDSDLESGKALLNSISVHGEEMERCYKMNAKFAVIEVLFKDGFTWKAK